MPGVSFFVIRRVGGLEVSGQARVSAKAFIDRFGITYPTITDDAILAKFTGQLSVNAIPTTLLIDKSGRVAARISGEITYSKMDELLIGLSNE